MIDLTKIKVMDIGSEFSENIIPKIESYDIESLKKEFRFNIEQLNKIKRQLEDESFLINYAELLTSFLEQSVVSERELMNIFRGSSAWLEIRNIDIRITMYFNIINNEVCFHPSSDETIEIGKVRPINLISYNKNSILFLKYICGLNSSDDIMNHFKEIFIKKAREKSKKLYKQSNSEFADVKSGKNIFEFVNNLDSFAYDFYMESNWFSFRGETINSMLFFSDKHYHKVTPNHFKVINKHINEIDKSYIKLAVDNLRSNNINWLSAPLDKLVEFEFLEESFIESIKNKKLYYYIMYAIAIENPTFWKAFLEKHNISSVDHFESKFKSDVSSLKIKFKNLPLLDIEFNEIDKSSFEELNNITNYIVNLKYDDQLTTSNIILFSEYDIELLSKSINRFNKSLPKQEKKYRGIYQEQVNDILSKLKVKI